MAATVRVHPQPRKWGAGTAALVRLLIASDVPLTQVALAEAIGVTQPRASQVLKQLTEARAVSSTVGGYLGSGGRLLDLYAERSRPHLVGPETYWYSTWPIREQAHQIVDAARDARVKLALSADLGPDLLAAWRHPTQVIVYVSGRCAWERAGLVRAEGRADASVIVRQTDDATLLTVNPPWPTVVDGIPVTDPVQQWCDLLDLGGDDRKEAADRLRRAILERRIAMAS